MFNDLIEVLLQKKANLKAEIEKEFAERSEKIDAMLEMCGYVEPKEEAFTSTYEDVEKVAEGVNGEAIY